MKRKAFPGHGPEVDAKYQRAGNFLRAVIFEDTRAKEWCALNGVAIRKAASESIDSAGGALVPVELSKAIIDIREQYGAFRRATRIVPMASDTTVMPRRVGGMTAYFMNENNPNATQSQAIVDDVNLTAKKIGAFVLASTEIEEDSLPDLVDYLANEIAWAFAQKEDDCAFNGDGTSLYAGMRGIGTIALDGNHAIAKVTAASGHNTFGGTAGIDNNDLGALMGAVRASAIPNAAWYASQVCFSRTMIALAAGAGGGALYVADWNGVMTPYFSGFPVVMCAKLPTVTTSLSGKVMLAFGDMYQGAVLGERRGITIKRSTDAYLHHDQLAILGTERFTANIHDMGDNSNAGSLAVLVGN